MEQMTKKHNETGRSMVEMLGVLAVVGVLSIGGVAGYRYAVDKMNANEIINELKKRAITVSQQRVLGQGINLSEYGDRALIKGTYSVSPISDYDGNASQFALEVAGVPERVCDMIIDSDWALPTAMAVNGGSCVDGGNIMTFAFNNTLESGDVGNGGNNDPTDTPTQQCGENEYLLADGTCKEDTKCTDPNQFWNGDTHSCTSCPTEGNPVRNNGSDMEDSCAKCAGAQQSAQDTYCVYCPSTRVACGDQCCGEGQQCRRNNSTYQYECVSGLSEGECLTNADCNNGSERGDYYCSHGWGCTQIVGTCQPATLYNNGASVDVHGKAVYRSANYMGWRAAKNFCTAHNMSLFNPKPYCTADEWSRIQSNGSDSCTNLAVTDDYLLGWTGSASGSCSAFYVSLDDGYVDNNGLSHSRYALCEGEGGYVPPVVSTEPDETATDTESTEMTDTETMTETQTQTETVTPTVSGEMVNPWEEVSCDEENVYPLLDGTCVFDGNCSDPNQFWNGRTGGCTACPTEGNPVLNDASDIEDSCTKCTNAQVGGFYDNYHCVYCPSNRVVCGDTCCGEGQQCKLNNSTYQYECVSGLGSNECLTNADCNNGSETGDYYCKNSYYGCGQMIGTCQPATLDNGGATLPVGTTTVVRSQDDSMGWYAAKNFCAAHNMSLFNPKPYCTADEWSSVQSNGWGYCTNLDVTNNSNWYGWTGSASGSCSAVSVNLVFGSVGDSSFGYSAYALCEK